MTSLAQMTSIGEIIAAHVMAAAWAMRERRTARIAERVAQARRAGA